ncbi:MAG: hypothetical protein P1U86_18840 [Verrucomicrobiales bacterium]|nr:hypothetical protein [Verrucomicrobiales bacterium]
MKKNSTHPFEESQLLQFSSISAALLIGLSLPVLAQEKVVIEGGPAEIQISDRDGQPEPVNPANNKLDEPPVVLTPEPDATVIQPVPNSNVEVLVPVKPVTPAGSVTADVKIAQTAPIAPKQISAEHSKRIAEIKRELEIAESATAARAILKAEEVFSEKTPVVDEAAKPTLKMLAEFMELSPKDTATVTYKYVATEESESSARQRAFAVVDYLSTMAGATTTEFTILDPKPVTVENPKATPSGQFVTEAEALIEITLK